MAKTGSRDITQGSIWKNLLLYFFPIWFGSIFQQLYTTIDAVIVGRYVGTEALAAGGATSGTTTVTVEFSDGMLTTISSSRTINGTDTPEQHQAVASELTLETAPTFNLSATNESGELDLSIDAVKANYEDLDFVCEVL